MADNLQTVIIDKLVHGGQGLGALADGRKCFVWGALPGETAEVMLTKKKRDWAEGVAESVTNPNPARVAPREPDIYLSTSPWQILDFGAELRAKQTILAETFAREHIDIKWQDFYQDQREFGYRNKMEYNFWFHNDTSRVDLALHRRGSHLKIAVSKSELASDAINEAGQALIAYINENHIEARPLKSVILRSDSSGKTGISIFVNDASAAALFAGFAHPNSLLEIIYSNPKSPASVSTEVLTVAEDGYLVDSLLGKEFQYSTRSFFQVNIPVYEAALKEIAGAVQASGQKNIIDMYSGVGSIGLSVVGDNQQLTMVEVSGESTEQARLNMVGRTNCKVVTATAESALDYITGNEVVILDPPRAGLHADVTSRLIETKPSKIIYLSCNPSTQARDIKQLVDAGYHIQHARGYNFFPRTPHIESLIVLDAVQ